MCGLTFNAPLTNLYFSFIYLTNLYFRFIYLTNLYFRFIYLTNLYFRFSQHMKCIDWHLVT